MAVMKTPARYVPCDDDTIHVTIDDTTTLCGNATPTNTPKASYGGVCAVCAGELAKSASLTLQKIVKTPTPAT